MLAKNAKNYSGEEKNVIIHKVVGVFSFTVKVSGIMQLSSLVGVIMGISRPQP